MAKLRTYQLGIVGETDYQAAKASGRVQALAYAVLFGVSNSEAIRTTPDTYSR